MLDRQFLIEREDRRDKEDKEWCKEQEERADGRHGEQLKVIQRIHKREMIIVAVGVTIVILIITVLGAAIEAGWFAPFFGLFD